MLLAHDTSLFETVQSGREGAPIFGAIVPFYDNPATIERVVAALRDRLAPVIIVDDGSHAEARAVVDRLARDPGVVLLRHDANRGKGAAVKTALREAERRGITHALQIDADAQHDLHDIDRFLALARRRPEALILGVPRFDTTLPISRRIGHAVANFWTRLHVSRASVGDGQCGFRVYPVAKTLALHVAGDRMDFDTEVAVRTAWAGCPIVNVPTRVRYHAPSEGGVSHFRLGRDLLLIVWMHVRLLARSVARSSR